MHGDMQRRAALYPPIPIKNRIVLCATGRRRPSDVDELKLVDFIRGADGKIVGIMLADRKSKRGGREIPVHFTGDTHAFIEEMLTTLGDQKQRTLWGNGKSVGKAFERYLRGARKTFKGHSGRSGHRICTTSGRVAAINRALRSGADIYTTAAFVGHGSPVTMQAYR